MLLLAAGGAEVVMALALKQAGAGTRLWPTVLGMSAAICSVVLLTLALGSLPLGPAYAVWTGIGAVGVTLAGFVLFNEALSWQRLAWMTLIFIGATGLRLQSATS
jgi:quaternary ammonium compound-resistance protein SugE